MKELKRLEDMPVINFEGMAYAMRRPNIEEVADKVNEIVDFVNEMDKMLRNTSITLDTDNISDSVLEDIKRELSKSVNAMPTGL